ncbi:hypothetical protein C3L33_12556, partial [Rhododendron williamsianum]
MAKPFQYHPLNLLLFFFFFLLFMVVVSIPDSDQLQSSQSHVLFEIQQLLNYPQVLSTWNQTTDFCNTEPNPSLTLVCYGGDLTQLHIISDNCWLPQTTMVPQSGFSSDSFFSTLSTLPSLKVLSLVCLGLWGPLPASIGRLSSLEILNMSSNYFSGPLLRSCNKFTGVLYGNTSCNARLAFVNLSSNYLTGELPRCLQSNSSTRIVQYSGNCLSQSSAQEQHPYPFCRIEALAVKINPHERERKSIKRSVLASSSVGGIFGGIALCVVLFLGMRRVYAKQTVKTPQTRLIVENVPPAYTLKMLSDARIKALLCEVKLALLGNSREPNSLFALIRLSCDNATTDSILLTGYISETMKLGALGLPPYRTFSLEELKEATSNFSSLNFIGEGSQGKVYKGILTDGTLVAIRSLKMRKKHGIQSYRHQIELISRLRHRHLVSFVGHSFECYPDDSSVSTIFLVQDFVPNGTLRSCISEEAVGNCELPGLKAAEPGPYDRGSFRTQVHLDTKDSSCNRSARGIQFLHTGIVPGVFSNDLKITDVLLDHELHVKINNYNLPLLAENRIQVCSGLYTLDGKTEQCFLKLYRGTANGDRNDVYDMGVILLEIIVGRVIMCQSSITIAKDLYNCLSNEPTDRPTVEDVLWNLQFAAQVQDLWRVDSNSNQGSPFKSTE